MFFILAFLYSMYGVVAWLIVEKETKIRCELRHRYTVGVY